MNMSFCPRALLQSFHIRSLGAADQARPLLRNDRSILPWRHCLMKISRLLLTAGVLFFFSTVASAKGVEVAKNAEWKVRMQAMLVEVLALFPFAFDAEKYNDPNNSAKIKSSVAKLTQHAEELRKHASHYKRDEGLKIDPSFPFIAEAFESELLQSQSDFKENRHRDSQYYLRSAIGKCMLCHSQTAIGPELDIDPFKPQFAALPPQDRFLAFAATRQFEKALTVLEESAKKPQIEKGGAIKFADLDHNTRAALAILVRVQRDPRRALEFLNNISVNDSTPSVFKNDLKAWKKSLIEWQNETPKNLNSDQELFAEAKKLKKKADAAQSAAGNFENTDISLLRASGLLHELLSSYPKSSSRAESYLMLATIYDALPGFAIWDLSDEYLGACIEENPHSAMGEKCFERYDENITLGYSGSMGTNIPAAVKEHLARMKALATVNKHK